MSQSYIQEKIGTWLDANFSETAIYYRGDEIPKGLDEFILVHFIPMPPDEKIKCIVSNAELRVYFHAKTEMRCYKISEVLIGQIEEKRVSGIEIGVRDPLGQSIDKGPLVELIYDFPLRYSA